MSEVATKTVTSAVTLLGAALLLFLIGLTWFNVQIATTCGGFGRGDVTLHIDPADFAPQVHCYGR